MKRRIFLVCLFYCFFRLPIYESIAAIFWQSASYVHILGNPDAMHNLGYMYENGFVHGSPKNNTASYLYFIDAAMKGQPDSALSLSAGQIYGDGIMLQNATSAAAWARNNAERLSAVGRLLQQGLKSFLKVIPIREFKNSNNFISPVK